MKQFIRANALKSTIGNLVANTVIPGALLLGSPLVNLKGPTPNLLSVLVPGVFMSALITTLVTFGVMTAQRKAGLLLPPLPPATRWFARALGEGVGIGLLFAVPALISILAVQFSAENAQLSRGLVVGIAAVVGAAVGFFSSLVASRRAARLGGLAVA
ncbi:hypothetical protein ACFQ48_17660 [Hymenobacter caeli]|uniref:ABC transporter permease n=1 Tax=Hymenobacter caeli TaxID=2735894 RepID=A0ABX2FX14_9BACT|nr:hypothetical protein [Hymenobacter caeli]NRT20824.1 hypothetical protein [Hymenobacter caeli]